MMTLALPEFALRVACAFGLGALIGFERQWRQRILRPVGQMMKREMVS